MDTIYYLIAGGGLFLLALLLLWITNNKPGFIPDLPNFTPNILKATKYLYHGTNNYSASQIRKTGGLKGRYNLGPSGSGGGGRRGQFEIPTLCVTDDIDTAKKYGNVILRFPYDKRFGYRMINNAGETEYRLEGKGRLVDAENIDVFFYSKYDNDFYNDYGEEIDPYNEEEAELENLIHSQTLD